jgi:YVTN family beta-propeller protein
VFFGKLGGHIAYMNERNSIVEAIKLKGLIMHSMNGMGVKNLALLSVLFAAHVGIAAQAASGVVTEVASAPQLDGFSPANSADAALDALEQKARAEICHAPALFASAPVQGRSLISCPSNDEAVLFDLAARKVLARYPTGKQPYRASISADGVYGFVPNRGGNSVTVIDLLNEKVIDTTKVCAQPEGGGFSTADVDYIVACNGGNQLDYINSASFEVVASVKNGAVAIATTNAAATGAGAGPSSVTISADGRYGLINHAAGDSVSVLDVAAKQIIGALKVGSHPGPVRMHPDGKLAYVAIQANQANQSDGKIATVSAIKLPPPPPRKTGGTPNQVIVMGMIHGDHLSSKRYSLKVMEQMFRNIAPDVVLTEMPPNRFDVAAEQFKRNGRITESRIEVFPEYIDVLFPLQRELKFAIVPTAAWTAPMNQYRNAATKRISNDLDRAREWADYKAAERRSAKALRQGGADDDPVWIHTDAYDAALEIELSAYNHFDPELGRGGWDTINKAHYANVERWLDDHPYEGKRVLITYGSAHKGWILRQLRERCDVTLLPMQPFLVMPE